MSSPTVCLIGGTLLDKIVPVKYSRLDPILGAPLVVLDSRIKLISRRSHLRGEYFDEDVEAAENHWLHAVQSVGEIYHGCNEDHYVEKKCTYIGERHFGAIRE